jgi:thiamine biosynthesis protein ThiS
MITVTVNSETRKLRAGTIAGLVGELGLPAPLLLVEHNGTALRKADWDSAVLRDGDRVEILRISAGG